MDPPFTSAEIELGLKSWSTKLAQENYPAVKVSVVFVKLVPSAPDEVTWILYVQSLL
jgi:hypothetical protein